MDEPGGVKRDATEAGLTSNSDTKRPVMEPPTSGRPGAEAASRTGAAAVTNGASTAGNGQETPVDLSHKPERGVFTETRTALLNHTAFFSMNKVDKSEPVVLRVRLNAPYSIYDDNTLVAQTINVAKLKGLSNCQSSEISANNYTTFTASNNFPTVIVGATAKMPTFTSAGAITDTAAIPAWRTYYEAIYESYSTISCDYTIYFEYSNNDPSAGSSIFIDKDAYTASSTGNVIPTSSVALQNYLVWKRVQQKRFGPRYTTGAGVAETTHHHTIKGRWTPGSIAKNTRNEEDIKTWYATGAGPTPNWVENLVLLGMADTFGTSSSESNFNIRVDLEYTVQFKDLKAHLRYPNSTDPIKQILTMPAMGIQVPYVTETVP